MAKIDLSTVDPADLLLELYHHVCFVVHPPIEWSDSQEDDMKKMVAGCTFKIHCKKCGVEWERGHECKWKEGDG
jgi:hypothetical protein